MKILPKEIPDVPEWHKELSVIKKIQLNGLILENSLTQLHNPKKKRRFKTRILSHMKGYLLMRYFSNLLIFSQVKKKNLTIYKKPKVFSPHIN
jgi:hypothetical protein